MAEQRVDAVIDARGLSCPLPLMKARQALMVLHTRAVVCVLATDPAARQDFEDFSEASGHELISIDERDGALAILMRKT